MKAVIILLILSTVFLFGCQGVDLSQVSDTDLERISEKAVVCNEPYIRFGTSCCLDENSNNICDTDEVKETAQLQEQPKEEVVVVKEPEVMEEEMMDDSEEEVEEPVSFIKPLGLLLCEGNEVADIGYMPKSAYITLCEGNRVIFGTTTLLLKDIGSTFAILEIGGQEYRFGGGAAREIETSDGTVEITIQSDGDEISLSLSRLTNPQGYSQ